MPLHKVLNPWPDVTIGVLLAGGASRRMGRAKASIDVAGRSLALRSADALSGAAPRCVQIGGDPVDGLGWPVVPDQRHGTGPGAGLETGLLQAPGCAVVVCPVDTPMLPASLLLDLLDRVEGGAIAAAPHFQGRWHPLTSACSPALLPALSAWLDAGRKDLQGLFDSVDAVRVETAALERHGVPDLILANANRAEDLDKIRDALVG